MAASMSKDFSDHCRALDMTTLEMVARGECSSVAPANMRHQNRRACAINELASRYANDYALWCEYIDPSASCYADRAEFDSAQLAARIELATKTCAANL